MGPVLRTDPLEVIIENSYKNFHVKGFDYICLNRTQRITQKFYFFNDNIDQMPEVVSPHNHRYNFTSQVLRGKMIDIRYRATEKRPLNGQGELYNLYHWETPLNGGRGFKQVGEAWLEAVEQNNLDELCHLPLITAHDQLHTIRILEPGTVLELFQFPDEIPIGKPTLTYFKGSAPASLDGLYEKFTEAEIIKYLIKIRDLSGRPLSGSLNIERERVH